MKKSSAVFFLMISLSCFSGNAIAQVMTPERALANEVMSMMGGQENFNNIRFLSWDFFGKRTLVWDKWQGRVRIDFLDEPLNIVVSLKSDEVMVVKDGKQITDPETLKNYLDKGRQIWMNDSYWLCMPFKLLDQGVQLKILGAGETVDGELTQVLELTFNQVGQTPENKYHVHVNPLTKMIVQWDYYIKSAEEFPTIVTPWTDYSWYGKVQFAAGRGAFGTLDNIRVWDDMPERVFTNLMVPALPKK